MQRSKVLLSSMIERFIKMDNGHKNAHLVEVVYHNIVNYAKVHNLYMFHEEEVAMLDHLHAARLNAQYNKLKKNNPWGYIDNIEWDTKPNNNIWDNGDGFDYLDDDNYYK
jgi:hypothetical protein